MTLRTGTAGLLLVIGAATFATTPPIAASITTARADVPIPLPPPRPVEFGGRPPDVALNARPDIPAPAPTPAVPAPVKTAVATLPRILPPATRERMHACGLEWQQVKRAGEAGERTWRDFAMECLPR